MRPSRRGRLPPTPRLEQRRAHGRSADAAPTRIAATRTSGSWSSQLHTAAPTEPTESSGVRPSAGAAPPATGSCSPATADEQDEPRARQARRARRAAQCSVTGISASGTSGSSPSRREERPGHEPQAVACVTPVRNEPAGSEDPVEPGRGHRDVSERKERDREREREAEARIEPAREAGREHEQRDELGRPERKERRAERGGNDAESDGEDRGARACGRERPVSDRLFLRVLRGARRSGARRARCGAPRRGPTRSGDGSDRARAPRRPRSRAGGEARVARVASGGAPAWIARATSWSGMPQNGWRSVSVSQSRTPTDQTSLCGVASPPARRSGAM